MRLPIVGVMGSGKDVSALSEEVGELIARRQAHLLTGGGRGQMEGVSRGFCRTPGRRGLCLAVLPCQAENQWTPPAGYPNPYVEIPIQTHLWLSGKQGEELASRNAINVLSSDAVVVLQGEAGTISEARMAIKARKPVALFLSSPLKSGSLMATLGLEPLSELTQLEQWLDEVLHGFGEDVKPSPGPPNSRHEPEL